MPADSPSCPLEDFTTEYVSCTDASCAETSSLIIANKDLISTLVLTNANQPRMLLRDSNSGSLQYAACDVDCGSSTNWQFSDINITLDPENQMDMIMPVVLALDPSNQPVLAYVKDGTLRLAFAPQAENQSWGAASVVGSHNSQEAEKVNYVLCFMVTLGMLGAWRIFREGASS